MNCAAKGRRGEHRARAILESAGFTVVRAAASKGVADLVAWGCHVHPIRQREMRVGVHVGYRTRTVARPGASGERGRRNLAVSGQVARPDHRTGLPTKVFMFL